MLAIEDFVADADDEILLFFIKPACSVIDQRSGLFNDGVGRNHLAWDKVVADAEIFQRPLCFCSPQPVGLNLDLTEGIGLDSEFWL